MKRGMKIGERRVPERISSVKMGNRRIDPEEKKERERERE